MRPWISLLVMMAGVSAVTAFIIVSLMTADDCKTFSGAPAIAEYQRDGRYLLDIGGGNITPLDSRGYIKYLEGVVDSLSSELDSLEIDDRYVAVIITTENDPEIIGRMGLRLPEGAQIKSAQGLLSGSWEEFPIDFYLDNRISKPEARAVKFGLVTFRYPKGPFPKVEEVIPPGATYWVTLTKAY